MYQNQSVNEIWKQRGHTRKPNIIVRGIYSVGDWFGDFHPLVSAVGRVSGSLALLTVNIIILIGIIVMSAAHSLDLLRRAGLNHGLEYVGVVVWELTFIFASILLAKQFKRGEWKRPSWAWAGFIVGFLFVEASNIMGMSGSWLGWIIGGATPFLLWISKGLLSDQFNQSNHESNVDQAHHDVDQTNHKLHHKPEQNHTINQDETIPQINQQNHEPDVGQPHHKPDENQTTNQPNETIAELETMGVVGEAVISSTKALTTQPHQQTTPQKVVEPNHTTSQNDGQNVVETKPQIIPEPNHKPDENQTTFPVVEKPEPVEEKPVNHDQPKPQTTPESNQNQTTNQRKTKPRTSRRQPGDMVGKRRVEKLLKAARAIYERDKKAPGRIKLVKEAGCKDDKEARAISAKFKEQLKAAK